MVNRKQASRPDGTRRWFAVYDKRRRVVWAKTAEGARQAARLAHSKVPDRIEPAPADWRLRARTDAPRLKRLSIRVTSAQLAELHRRRKAVGANTVAEYVLSRALG